MPAAWNVVSARIISDGIGGKVYRVTRADGSQAVVKQPSAAALVDADRAADYLRWRDGASAVRLLDRREGLLLLEFLPGPRLADIAATRTDAEATAIAADLLAALHAPAGAAVPNSLQPLRDRFSGLFARAGQDRRAGLASQYVEAATVAERLLDAGHAALPLHGDLHHENILMAPRGWAAIDPVGLLGDPAFDAANLFHNPLRYPLRQDTRRIAGMARILSARLGHDCTRLLDHAFAYSALSAAWHEEDGQAEEAAHALAVGRAVAEVRGSI